VLTIASYRRTVQDDMDELIPTVHGDANATEIRRCGRQRQLLDSIPVVAGTNSAHRSNERATADNRSRRSGKRS
jgi:hypothetical protein